MCSGRFYRERYSIFDLRCPGALAPGVQIYTEDMGRAGAEEEGFTIHILQKGGERYARI